MAIVNIAGELKYYELLGLKSLLQRYQKPKQQIALNLAINAILSVENLEEVSEFEGNMPVQGSLF